MELACATVDHGLRPEAAAEAAGVARLCNRLGIAHETLVWRPQRAGVSQADARDARRSLLAGWAHARALGAIAMGHTADDRIETFLIRARAGSGWYGLAGPMPSAPSPHVGVRLIRPLLRARRETLQSLLRDRREAWVDDPTNANTRYERVRMRALAGAAPEAGLAILRIMDRLAAMRAAVMTEARRVLLASECNSDCLRVGTSAYRETGAEARLRLLEALVTASRPGAPPPDRGGLERLDARLTGGEMRGSTLGRLAVRIGKTAIEVAIAPPRRGETGDEVANIQLTMVVERARDMLEDPVLTCLETGNRVDQPPG